MLHVLYIINIFIATTMVTYYAGVAGGSELGESQLSVPSSSHYLALSL